MTKNKGRVLVACEESQRVCTAFRELGYEAYSCDIKACSGGHPEWHLRCDANLAIEEIRPTLLIAHPPCTYLCCASAVRLYLDKGTKINEERYEKLVQARKFFMSLYNADVKHIAVENPKPLKAACLPTSTQVIQPYEYGHPYSKATHLWLRGLPPLMPTEICADYETTATAAWFNNCSNKATARSKTFEGIAKAMADQWGDYVND